MTGVKSFDPGFPLDLNSRYALSLSQRPALSHLFVWGLLPERVIVQDLNALLTFLSSFETKLIILFSRSKKTKPGVLLHLLQPYLISLQR